MTTPSAFYRFQARSHCEALYGECNYAGGDDTNIEYTTNFLRYHLSTEVLNYMTKSCFNDWQWSQLWSGQRNQVNKDNNGTEARIFPPGTLNPNVTQTENKRLADEMEEDDNALPDTLPPLVGTEIRGTTARRQNLVGTGSSKAETPVNLIQQREEIQFCLD